MRLMATGLCLGALVSCVAADCENIARGKPYSFSVPPSYRHCTDAGDRTQLTDGEYVKGYFWVQKGTVGWNMGSGPGVRTVTVDLGKDEPITGFSWNFGAGVAGVRWPSLIYVYTSIDGKAWHFIGDLYARSKSEHGAPDETRYGVYRAWSQAMPCHGRYVAFLVQEAGFLFCDELEVYRGDASLLAQALPGTATPSPLAHHEIQRVRDAFRADADAVAAAGGTVEAALRREIDTCELDASKPTIEPLAPVQRKIFACNAAVLRKAGFTAPAFCATDRWANHNPLAVPSGAAEPEPVVAMRGETRATAVGLVNPTARALLFRVSVRDFPSGAHPELREVVYTRAKDGRRISGALKPISGTVEVPAGTTKQLWIAFVKPDASPGEHVGRLVAEADGMTAVSTTLRLALAKRVFPARPRMHVGGWDYSEAGNGYYRSPSNLMAKIARMREMHVDTPWATMRVAPKGAKFGKEGELLNRDALDYSEWQAWTALWGDLARQYAVFVAGGKTFHGEPIGTPRCRRMVKEYFGAWYAHAAANGLGARRFVLLPYDEPSTAAADAQALEWCRALKAADARFVIFEDPTHADPKKADAALYAASDVLCPNMRQFHTGTDAPFFLDWRKKGKELWLYSCSGPSRTFDPLTYYRTQGWYAWRLGAKGTFFWALGCGGGIGDSWHAFAQTGTEYSPFFVSQTDAMASKQSEAVRESVQDYEYLALLADEIAARRAQGRDVSRLERILTDAPARALGEKDAQDYSLPLSPDYDWDAPGARPAMDAVRREILDAL